MSERKRSDISLSPTIFAQKYSRIRYSGCTGELASLTVSRNCRSVGSPRCQIVTTSSNQTDSPGIYAKRIRVATIRIPNKTAGTMRSLGTVTFVSDSK